MSKRWSVESRVLDDGLCEGRRKEENILNERGREREPSSWKEDLGRNVQMT